MKMTIVIPLIARSGGYAALLMIWARVTATYFWTRMDADNSFSFCPGQTAFARIVERLGLEVFCPERSDTKWGGN
jgi:hypothetical protein